jgi:uncharacterized protein YqeY
MPSLTDIDSAIAAAMKARERITLDALRMLKTAITVKAVERGHDLDEREVQQVVSSLVKQRRDSIEQFTKGGRQDLADKEAAEIAVLERYLPAAASADDIARAVAAAVSETGAAGAKDFGKVMKAAMAKLSGATVDGKVVSDAVREHLARLSG